jgi:hypothetical protein
LPEHKHPFPRYAYVLAGALRVEAIDQWHRGTSLDNGPVKLLVIDQVPGDVPNTVMRN